MARRIDYQKLLHDGIPLGDGWLMKYLHVDELETDYRYQRFPTESNISNIVENFDQRYVGQLTVGRRANGKHYTLDGNHRKHAIQRMIDMGESISPYVRSCILLDSTPRVEANIFVGRNTVNKVQGVALYKACLFLRKEPHVTIEKILAKYGFEVELLTSGKPSARNGVGLRGAPTILSAFKMAEDHFDSAARILANVWKRDTEAHSGEFLKGISTFLVTQVGTYDASRLNGIIGRLRGTPAINGIDMAKVENHSSKRIKRLAKWMADVAGVHRSIEYLAAA